MYSHKQCQPSAGSDITVVSPAVLAAVAAVSGGNIHSTQLCLELCWKALSSCQIQAKFNYFHFDAAQLHEIQMCSPDLAVVGRKLIYGSIG